MVEKSWAAPPYQVVCYSFQTNKASTSSLTGSGGAINWNTDVPWADLTVIADAFYQPNTNNTFSAAGAKGNSLITAAHANGVRCIVSLGGAGQDGAFGTVCLPANRAAFASAVSNLVATNGYDGVDIDWETNGAASQADATAMMQLIYQDIKALPNSAFDNKPRTLSFATVDYINTIYNMTTLGSYTDWAFYMGYDWYDCPNRYNGPLNLIKTGIGNITNGNTWSYPISKVVLGCPLYTNDYNGGCGAAEYNTLSILHMGTAGAYSSTYAEQSYTAPNSDIVYVDTTQSFCDKTNWAIGAGLKGIGMWDLGQGLPYTDSLMAPIWSVIGGTSACLAVVGATSTPTKTSTSTPTKTSTSTPTASGTATRTPSSTPTATRTATSGSTSTFTGTPSATPSSTPTWTHSMTMTPSSTATRTTSSTATGTATLTPTRTNSATGTPTNSPINTASSTATKTFTLTASTTATFSPTLTATPTASPTRTFTLTVTSTSTNTAIITPTPTSTATKTSTSSFTSTPAVTLTFTNTALITPTSTSTFTFTATPTPTFSATHSSTPNPTGTATSTFSSTRSSTPTRTNTMTSTSTLIPTSSSTATWTPSRTFAPSATWTFTPTDSRTPTASFTASPSATPTVTFSSTFTSTSTFTATLSFTPTSTWTPTSTRTSTATQNTNGKPILYPNPDPGPTVDLLPPPYGGTGTIIVDVFTGAFRKVAHWDFAGVPSGVAVIVPLTDDHGSPLANGLYYLRVRTPGGQFSSKLMVLH